MKPPTARYYGVVIALMVGCLAGCPGKHIPREAETSVTIADVEYKIVLDGTTITRGTPINVIVKAVAHKEIDTTISVDKVRFVLNAIGQVDSVAEAQFDAQWTREANDWSFEIKNVFRLPGNAADEQHGKDVPEGYYSLTTQFLRGETELGRTHPLEIWIGRLRE